ncbi:MAG: adenylate/guanylate cyclase domain-containing protein, partial [Leptospiraceae bacterium]|nr:adenylate/guanylate cyclase domain-containing protein [Leptospiraceae bacterium]
MSPITKDHFFEIFPWGTNHLSLGKPINWFWQFELDLPVEFVWPHLVDTSRLNRLFKLPKMEFQEKDGVLYGKTNYFGLKTEWK